MRLQVFLYSKFGYAQAIADEISEMFNCKCDQIPPAYQCDEEKLVFIVYEKYGSLDKKLTEYMNEMDSKKCINIAFIEVSNTGSEALDQLSKLVESHGVNVSGTHSVIVKHGFMHKGKLTQEQLEDCKKFADEQGKKNFEFLRKQAKA